MAVAAAVGFHGTAAFDLAATHAVQSIGNAPLDWTLSLFSYVGSIEFTGLATLFLFGAIWRVAGRAMAIRFLAIFAVGSLLELACKSAVPQAPIPPELFRSKLVGRLMHVETNYSFPSGHAFRTVYLALALAWWVTRRGKVAANPVWFRLAVGLGVAMGFSRIYLGDHWTTDVLGGGLLAVAGALILTGKPGAAAVPVSTES